MKQTNIDISAVIITRNEEERIAKCIQSISFCREIIVVDNKSTDQTVPIAQKHGAKVFINERVGFAELRNEAIRHAQGSWLLFIDADEAVSEELAVNIRSAVNTHDPSVAMAFLLKRKNYYLGALWPHVEVMERLFSKGSGVRWTGVLHETPQFEGIRAPLSGYLVHNTHRTLEEMVQKTNEWSNYEAKLRFDAKHPKLAWWRFLRVMVTAFWDSFVGQKGFGAGKLGWVESMYQSFSIFITYAKLWEMQQAKEAK